MPFNNQANKVKLIGYIVSDLTYPNEYALEFDICVKRKAKLGEKVYSDRFTVYVSQATTKEFCIEKLNKGLTIQVNGELRNWKDGTNKVCCDEITLKG